MSREVLMAQTFELLQQQGKLPHASLASALRGAGLNPSEAQLRNLLAGVTRDVDFAGYEALVARCAAAMADERDGDGGMADTAEAVRDAFRVFDHDGSGTVALSEFRHIMTTMGEKYTDDEFRELVTGFDDGGVIHYEQLVDAMLAPYTDLAQQQQQQQQHS